MKKVLMATLTIIVAILISALVLYINVFSDKAKKNIAKEEKALVEEKENITETYEEEGHQKILKEIEEKAKENIENDEITEAKIDEAITYIETNIEISEEEKNIETIKQIAYYGAYLKNLTKYKSDEKKNEISILGENAYIYSNEALKFIEKQEKIKDSKEEIPTNETTVTPIETQISEETEKQTTNNVIEVNTSTTLGKTKTEVRISIVKVNNLNRKKLVTELKERIDNSSQNN